MLFLIITSALFIGFYFYNNRLFLIEAKLLWPQRAFDSASFKTGNVDDRASMVMDLIESQLFVGEPMTLVLESLGIPTGDYYHQDINYTYRLTNKGHADWILTFVSDNNGLVIRVFIRKSCCSVSTKVVRGIFNLMP